MSLTAKRNILRFLVFGRLGLVLEVFFTAVMSGVHGNWNLQGGTSPWMMLDYGLIGVVLMPAAARMKAFGIPLAGRAVAYMLAIFVVEFISGWLFDCAGLKIWDYSHLPLNLYGYITLTYAPLWYALSLVLEWVYVRVDAIVLVLVLGLRAADIEKAFPPREPAA